MSNVDPRYVNPGWAPPESTPHQPHRIAYAFAIVLPILLIVALAVPLGIAYQISRLGLAPATAGSPVPNSSASGDAGAGDPYFRDYGSTGYDAIKYDISINFDPGPQVISGMTKITARATKRLESFFYDLVLDTEQVSVNGQPATFERQGFQDVKITPATPVNAGAVFEVVVNYSGAPGRITPRERRPWLVTNQEWTAAGEPESAAWWYPSDDYPADPALMDITVRVPAGMEVISVGRLESADTGTEPGFDTWHWVARQPMATYLSFVSIGQYEIRRGVVDGRPSVYAVTEQLSPGNRNKAFAVMERSGEIVRQLERWFGPYPFTEIGGVVPAHQFGFGGLETQTRPVYAASALLDAGADVLVAHELSHMWFGDNVTLRQWNDICINECWASWGQWAYAESSGGEKLNDHLNRAYNALKGDEAYWHITLIDPGPGHLFDVVYTRGPMMLQALRNRIGDPAFFSLARNWAQDPGSRSLEEWMIKAQATTKIDLVPFFRAWVFGTTPPARTAENGF